MDGTDHPWSVELIPLSCLIYFHLPLKGFPCGSASKESACNAGDLGLISWLGRFPGERKGYPLQYSGLEKSMEYIVHGVTKSQTRMSDFHFHFHANLISVGKYVKYVS